MTEYDFTFKVLLIGDSSVKKELINYLFPETLNSGPALVLNVDFYIKTINYNGKKIKIMFWVRRALDRFNILLGIFLKDSSGVVIVNDSLNLEFLNKLADWNPIIRKKAGSVPIILVKLKSDLDDSKKIQQEELLPLAKNYITNYFEIKRKECKESEQLIQDFAKILLNYHTAVKEDSLNYNST